MKHWLIIVFIIHGFYLFAEETYKIDKAVTEINLKNYCYHFEDTTNSRTVNQALRHNWQKLAKNPTFASNKYVQWLRYNFYNPYDTNLVRIIFIPYHLIHEIDVYTVADSTITNISSTGIKRPFSDKHIKSTGYPIRIKLKPDQTLSVLIRLKHLYRPLRASTYLLTEQRAIDVIQENNSLIWFWRGVFLFALFISIVIYFSVKQKLFLYYFLLNLGFGIFIASQLGDYFLFFEIDSTDITSVIDFTGAIIGILLFPLFLNALTPIKKRNEILWKWMYRVIYFMIVIYVFSLFPSIRASIAMYYFHFYIMIVSGLVLSLQLILLIKNIIYKDKNAIPLFIIYSIYIITMFVEIIFANMGILADSPYVNVGLLLVSVFEIFAFMGLMANESLKVYKERSELVEKQQDVTRNEKYTTFGNMRYIKIGNQEYITSS
ncbi:MAG: hypothetical protein HQ521_07535, partial [Bacteroidetes bacterium]|nr:hypothetical protein [Bacteroidota bacterium]